ncbi:MAG TPA: helix-turn-helix domain-containing protein [Noviherbaspirillum sp.]
MLGDAFHLTQEFLASMLNVHRPTINLVAGALQQAGIIRYNRGRMAILQRQALEDVCCECHDLVNKRFESTLGTRHKR